MPEVNSSLDTLGQRICTEIRVLMVRQNRRQSELAEALGVSQPAVSRYLTGERPLDVDDLDKIARFLGVAVTDLMASAVAA